MTLVAVWTRQYLREADLKSDRICMTDERLNRIVNDAYDAGVMDGKSLGRVEMRQNIESGEIPPIKPDPFITARSEDDPEEPSARCRGCARPLGAPHRIECPYEHGRLVDNMQTRIEPV